MTHIDPQATGYIPRNYEAYPVGYAHPVYDGPRYSISELAELDELNKKERYSPYYIEKDNNLPVDSQGSWGYCWCWGVGNAMMNRLAAMGLDPTPRLNPHSTAYLGKRGRNQGGFGTEATRYIEQFGMAEQKDWPGHKRISRPSQELKDAMAVNKLVQFKELPARDLVAVASAILCPERSSPVSVAFNWWRHLVCAVDAHVVSGKIELVIKNSWGPNWKGDGFDTLRGRKAVPDEAIVVESVLGREE